MERKVTKLENCHVEVLVSVDTETWKDAQNKSFNKLAKNVTVDGFRKGKAPLNLVKDKIDPMKMMDDAINSLLPSLYKECLDEEKIQPFAQPKVEVSKLSDSELEIKFVITTAPEVKLGKYTGIEIGKNEVRVSEEEINKAVEDAFAQNASLVLKEDKAALGDTVNIDFEGFIDGKAFDGGKAENHELVLGSNSFIPGFEDSIVGHQAGEEFDINVTFPDNYVEELKGKDATFKVKLHEVKQKVTPEINDESVKELNIPNVENLEQLKENKKAELLRNKTNEEKRNYLNKLMIEIVKNSEINVPEEIIDDQCQHVLQDMTNRIQQSGLTLDQYLQIIGQSEEELHAKIKEDSKKDVEAYFVTKAIGERENLSITDEEFEFELAKMADQYQMTIDAIKKALDNQLEQFKNNLAMRKIDDFLLDSNE